MIEYFAFAIGDRTIEPPSSLNQTNATVPVIINNALTIFISAGIILSVVMLIWSGIQWITSGGDKQKLASARGRLTWAIIGLAIILLSFTIIGIINFMFGINLLNFNTG